MGPLIPYLYLVCGGVAMYFGDKVQASHRQRRIIHYPAAFIEGTGAVVVIYSMSFFH